MQSPSKKISDFFKRQFLVSPRATLLLQILGFALVMGAFMFYNEWTIYRQFYFTPEIQLAPGLPRQSDWFCQLYRDCPRRIKC